MSTIDEILITLGLIAIIALVIGIRYYLRLKEVEEEQKRAYMKPIKMETNKEPKNKET